MNLSKAERIRKDVSRIEREIKEGDTSSLRGLCKLAHELLDVIENKPATREKQFQDVLKNAIEEARECSA